jgi:hypothetical protein
MPHRPFLPVSALALAAAALIAGPGATPAAADVAYGVESSTNRIFEVNLATGDLTNAVPITLTGFTVNGATALTAHPTTGAVWGVVKTAAGQLGRKLCTIDPSTGAATLVGDAPDGTSSIAFNSAGTLYAMTGQGATPSATLFTLSTVNAAATMVFGPITTGADGEVIAFAPGDALYHSSGNGTAVFSRITFGPDTATPLGSAAGEIFGMGYSPALGAMLGTTINSELVSIDLASGARTLIASTILPGSPDPEFIDVRGLAILAGVTPGEPGACCQGATCTFVPATMCTAPGSAFVGPGSVCSPQVLGGAVNACCKADFNGAGGVTVQDIFDFLSAYFAGCP